MPEIQELRHTSQISLYDILDERVEVLLNSGGTITKDMAAGLYAVMACMELPCHSDVSATLRKLVRKCNAIRASIETTKDDRLPYLNILIVIGGGLFRQDEEMSLLWDEELY